MRRIVLLGLLLMAPLAGAEVRAIFDAGETLDFNLTWTRVSGGSARMTIAPIPNDRYRITSVGKSGAFFSRIFKVRDEIESLVDRGDFSTLQYHKVLDERGKKKDELTVIDESRKVATRKGKTIPVPKPIYDPLSLIYYIRTLDLSPGQTHEFPVISDGKLYTLHVIVLRREKLVTPAGTFETVVIEPRMESTAGIYRDDQNRLLLWYSDDERKIPVRIRSELNIGSITATLRAITPGVSGADPVD